MRIVHLKRVRFIRRRKAVGLTQEDLADALHVERSTVGRWERAETEPQPWLRPRLAALLKVTADELEALLADVVPVPGRADDRLVHSSVPLDFSLTDDHTVRILEGFSAYDIASRRQVVAGLAVLSGSALLQPIRQWVAGLPVTPAPADPTPEAITELEQAIVLFRRWDASGAGGLRRKAVVGQLNAVTESLTERHDPETTRRLFHAAAELAQLAGWMAYDQGLHGMAQRYYVLALHACREAAAPALGAKIIGDMTQLSTALGNHTDSLNLTRAALYGLPHSADDRVGDAVRAELLGLEARAYAHLGEREAGNAVRSAEACVEVWQEARGEPRPDWLHYLDQAEVDCLAANVHIELALASDEPRRWRRFAARAERHTLNARAARVAGYTRSRVLDEMRLARVRLAQREPAEAAAVACDALRLAEGARSSLAVDWFVRFDAALAGRHPGCREAAAFHERLRDYLRRAAPQREREIVRAGV